MRAEARDGDPRRRRAGVREAAHDDPRASTCRRRAPRSPRRAMPDGEAYYQAMIEKFTTLDLTRAADPRHRPEGSRAHQGRDGGDEAAGRLQGDDGGVLPRSCAPIRSSTPRRRASCCRTRRTSRRRPTGSSRETIGFLPRRRHGILPVPDALAPIYTGGRGGLEACLMNTYNLPARPLYTLRVADAARVHARATASRRRSRSKGPSVRRSAAARRSPATAKAGDSTPSGSGTVMGIYETPYEDFGRLTYEMWRAVPAGHRHRHPPVRLDAASRRWTTCATTRALSEHEITTEVDRYIAWPGQALAYKLGEMQIRRHRREAEEKLGAEVRPAALPRRDPGARLGAAAGAGAAHGAVHRRRRREPIGGR